jgi:hypothetical protein
VTGGHDPYGDYRLCSGRAAANGGSGFVHWLAAVQTAIVALDETALDDEERE